MPELRFDDLRSQPPRSFGFSRPREVLVATEVSQVTEVLAAVERATDDGAWAAGFLSYEAAPAFDLHLRVRPQAGDDPLPLAWFGIFETQVELPPLEPSGASYGAYRWEPSASRADYEEQVDTIREHIRAGESYQVNHTIRLHGRFAGSAPAFYTALSLAQRGAHGAYIDTGRHRILSASPELFFALDEDGTLTTRPMKGTAARGRFPDEDRAAAATLLSTEKERAENAMIVDLLRNDMGRISQPGSVEVTELFDVERYETVWQMTSTIRSRLRPDAGLTQVFGALFPSGSVTGAPKVRSMEIIADLETLPRGIYCGAIGWVAPRATPRATASGGRRAEFNVAIRTVALDTATDILEYGVGGGITFDSVPAREYRECLAKSRVLTTRRPPFELLETLSFRNGEIQHLQEHLERMANSADYFGFSFDPALATQALNAAATEPCVLQLSCDRSGAFRVTTRALPSLNGDTVVKLAIDDEPVDANDPFLFHKTTLREPYERRELRHPGADQIVLCNARGEITETTIANIAIRQGKRWVTPSLDAGLLAGVKRALLLADRSIEEGTITRAQLEDAKELAVFNAVRGWQVARML